MLSNAQLVEIVKKGKESKERKFPESVEAIVTFKEVDPKKNDLNINETVYLPHPGSHKATVCYIGSGDLLLRAKNAGRRRRPGTFSARELRREQERGQGAGQQIRFLPGGHVVDAADRQGSRNGVGPQRQDPDPVPPNAPIEAIINRTRSAVRVRSRAALAVGAKVGDRKLSDTDLADNIQAMVQAVQRKLPNGDRNIRSIIVKTSMGKPVRRKVDES